MQDLTPLAYQHMISGVVACSSSALTAVRVGSSNLENRKWLLIQVAAAGTTKIFIGSKSSIGTDITAPLLAKYGIKLKDGQLLWLPVSEAITIYAVSNTGAGKRLRVSEFA